MSHSPEEDEQQGEAKDEIKQEVKTKEKKTVTFNLEPMIQTSEHEEQLSSDTEILDTSTTITKMTKKKVRKVQVRRVRQSLTLDAILN